MIFKRTWLSSLLWAVYTCVAGVLLAIYAVLFWKNEIGTGTVYYMIAFVALVLVLIIACCLLINKAASKIRSKYRISRRAATIWEIITVFCICCAGLIYRVEMYMHYGLHSMEVTEHYLAASGNIGEYAEIILHGASYLYILCLSFILSFFENATVWLHIFIQTATLLLAYFAVKKMVGKIAACITMLMLAVSSVYVNQIFITSPEGLFFALYLIGMITVGDYVKSYCRNRLNAVTAICGAVLSGIVIGTLTYLDAVSVTLFVLLPGLITGICKTNEDEEKSKTFTTQFAVLLIILVVSTAILMVMGAFALDAYASGLAYREVAEAWLELYMSYLRINYMPHLSEYYVIEYVQIIMAVFLVISFWNTEKKQNASPWIVLMLLIAPTPPARIGVLPYQVFSIFIWSALAGIGFQQSCISEVKYTVKAAESENAAKTEKVTETSEAETVEIAEKTEQSAESQNNKPDPKPRFIENPLPLPKKHVRKELDFQYEVPEDKMKFDIEIKENDDFDI